MSNSYFLGNLGESILLHVFLLEAWNIYIFNISFLTLNTGTFIFLRFFQKITVRNQVPSENIHAGTLFLTVIPKGT
jgi:hypothetical protein